MATARPPGPFGRPRGAVAARAPRWGPRWLDLTLLGGAVLALGGLFSLFTLPEHEALAAMLVLAGGVGALALVFPRLVIPNDRAFMLKVVVAGLLIRLGLAVLAHAHLPVGFFAPDQYTFQDVGWRTLRFLRGEGPAPWQIRDTLEVGYYYWNAILFALFGFAPLAPKLINAFLGVAVGMMGYRMAGELLGRQPARTAAVLITFFPSLVLWSTQNLRDTPTVFLLMFLFWQVFRLRTRVTGSGILGVLVSLSLLALLRDYLAVVVAVTLIGSVLISPARKLHTNIFIGLVLFTFGVLANQRFGLATETLESASFESLTRQREALATGGSAFGTGFDTSTPQGSLLYLPRGLVYFLFAPFPWMVGSRLSLMALPEMLVWYALIPMVIGGARYLLRRKFFEVLPMLFFLTVTSAVYALVEGNAGTAYRHRAQVLVFFLLMASGGLSLWRTRRKSQVTTRSSMLRL